MTPLPIGVCITVLAAMAAWAPVLETRTAPQTAETSSQLEARAREAETAGRTQEAFDLYVRALQGLPKEARDFTLREKIVALALKLDSPPAVPAQVERHSMRARAMIDTATNEDDLDAAVAEMQLAVRAAPWVPALAYNLALVREQQQYYGAADENLKLYLLWKPEDAEEVRWKMYALEIKRERDLLSKEREACALESRDDDSRACAGLVIEAKKMGYAVTFDAYDFACRKRQRFCGSLAAQILRAAAAERYPKNVVDEITQNAQALKAADVKVDPERVPDLIVTSCRKEPDSCGLDLLAVYRIAEVEKQAATEARDAEGLPYTGDTTTDGIVAIASLFRRGPRTPWVDGFFAKIGSKLSCSPSQPADCLAAGYLAEDGLGRKDDKKEAKALFERGCNGGVTAACQAFARAVGHSSPNVWATNVPGLQVDLRVAGDTALVMFSGPPLFDGIRTTLRKIASGYSGTIRRRAELPATLNYASSRTRGKDRLHVSIAP